MDQDTGASFGVVTEIKLTFENWSRILQILEEVWKKSTPIYIKCKCLSKTGIDDFGSKLCDFLGEKECIGEYQSESQSYYQWELRYLKKIRTEDEVDIFLDEIGLADNSSLLLIHDFIETFVHNLSKGRRFEFEEISVDQLITEIQTAQKYFIELGFTADQIRIGSDVFNG